MQRRSKSKNKSSSTILKQPSLVQQCPPVDVSRTFPVFSPFPQEGIVGMYPIFSTCKKEVADHMAEFQRRLEREMCETRMQAQVRYPDAMEESLGRVVCEMRELENEIEDLKHRLAVELIKKKYQKHESYCPCSDD